MFVHKTITKNHQKGFTLLETLIAFVILSVGLLGIVNLQAMSKKFTHQAVQRSLAVSFADAIVERIRINPTAIGTYITAATAGTAAVGGATLGTQPVPTCYDTAVCDSVQLATQDLWKWEQALDGSSSVSADGANTAGLISPKACFDAFVPRAGMLRTGFLTVRVQWTGLNRLSDAVNVANTNCNGTAANNDPFRRQVVVTTYIIDETEI